MKKIYPSRFALPLGSTLKAPFRQSCPRYAAVLAEHPEEVDIDPLYKAIGLIGEERAIAALTNEGFRVVHRELPLQTVIYGDVTISGRADLIVEQDGFEHVVEVKTTISAGKRAALRQGKVNPAHIGQLITYMVLSNRKYGILCSSYVHFTRPPTDLSFEATQIGIEIGENEEIYIDGERYAYTVRDLWKFYHITAQALIGADVPPRTTEEYACRTCPLEKICSAGPQDRTEFIRSSIQALEELPEQSAEGRDVSIKCHNTRRRMNDE